MAKKKQYIYRICVESHSEYNVYDIKADSLPEAKKKAKAKFMKDNWKPKSLKCFMEDKQINY